jgi:hypothetical protein
LRAGKRLSASQGSPVGAESRNDYKVLPGEATMDEAAAETSAVTGGVNILLRREGLTLFAGMMLLYAAWGGSWLVFALLFLVPDLSFLAYLSDARFGAIIYNAAHSYMAPMTLMTLWPEIFGRIRLHPSRPDRPAEGRLIPARPGGGMATILLARSR